LGIGWGPRWGRQKQWLPQLSTCQMSTAGAPTSRATGRIK
jgi:hypothetical protein